MVIGTREGFGSKLFTSNIRTFTSVRRKKLGWDLGLRNGLPGTTTETLKIIYPFFFGEKFFILLVFVWLVAFLIYIVVGRYLDGNN